MSFRVIMIWSFLIFDLLKASGSSSFQLSRNGYTANLDIWSIPTVYPTRKWRIILLESSLDFIVSFEVLRCKVIYKKNHTAWYMYIHKTVHQIFLRICDVKKQNILCDNVILKYAGGWFANWPFCSSSAVYPGSSDPFL